VREGQASQTAALVALGRAAAHRQQLVPGFSDPYAEHFLPLRQKAMFAKLERSASARNFLLRPFLRRLSLGMALRTLAIDEALRAGLHGDQLIILGAGLDARAWRLPELKAVRVFEVDHPWTQAWKKARAAELPATSVQFVGVDFARDSLNQRLAEAGHDASRPTVWIWEGVVMYMELPAIEATLRVIRDRSTEGSRLIVSYASPAMWRRLGGAALRLLGEPWRAAHEPAEMAALLGRHSFAVVSDEGATDWNQRFVPRPERLSTTVRSQRVVVAERSPLGGHPAR
jgi:methyltransferase (TIGR00027 family)